MRILGINTQQHDGGLAYVDSGALEWSIEAQVDSRRRHSQLTTDRLYAAFDWLDDEPDVLAQSGWFNSAPGYYGSSDEYSIVDVDRGASSPLTTFSCTHERSHLMCSYGLSPFPQGQPCYALIWEGTIGSIYFIDERLNVTKICSPVGEPGHRYAFGYELVDARFPATSRGHSMSVAGKFMALAGCPSRASGPPVTEVVHRILSNREEMRLCKADYDGSPLWNVGVDSDLAKALARCLTDELYELFFRAFETHCRQGYPLLIGGGCGLNCEWNTKLLNRSFFCDVFIPPCTDDSGIAIGNAIAAQWHLTRHAKLRWTVYAGEPFNHDTRELPRHWMRREFCPSRVAEFIKAGAIIAWIQGRAEIGPRALGHRSILASPFSRSTTDRLNEIKDREAYRPIAPICRRERFSQHFSGEYTNEYMLLFSRVNDPDLKAVTHFDGSARVQVIPEGSTERVGELLDAFEQKTRVGVLCNTSLNFSSCGFINRMSDLITFVESYKLNGAVIDGIFYEVYKQDTLV